MLFDASATPPSTPVATASAPVVVRPIENAVDGPVVVRTTGTGVGCGVPVSWCSGVGT